ncbi:MAG TPA: hypothetical protein VKK31_01005 [Thermoanaerobaculia bacterium]|nr:hypothetical protein [Thermoanaerobaculia bacterium]
MDPKLLADALTTFIAPALPSLVSGGGELVKAAGETLGEKGVELIKSLWSKLRPKVEEKPAAAEAVQDTAKAPDDTAALEALQMQLRKILEADPSFAAEIAKLLEGAGPKASYHAEVHGDGAIAQGEGNVAAGAGGIAAGRDVRSSKNKS